MKKLITILSFLLLWQVMTAKAQPYQSIFGDPTTEWVFIWNNFAGWINDTAFIEKDTVVNGMNYKKVSTKVYGKWGGLIRENTDSGYVWYREISSCPEATDTVELLIFNFGVNVGDTFEIAYNYYYKNDSCKVVDSIRYINGVKHIYFKCNYLLYNEPMTMIEGIGSNMGVLTKICATAEFMRNKYLLCSYKNGQKTSYVNKSHNGICWQYNSIAQTSTGHNNISLYPQPAKGTVHINNKNNTAITKVEITNLMGQCVWNTSASEIYSMDVGNIPPGYYLVKLFSVHNQITTLPMVIQ